MEPEETNPKKYKRIFEIGLLVFALIVTTLSIFLLLSTVFVGQQNSSQSVLQSEVAIAEAIAEKREREVRSYVGVCESVLPVVTTAEVFECEDGKEFWSVRAGNEEGFWCAGSDREVRRCE